MPRAKQLLILLAGLCLAQGAAAQSCNATNTFVCDLFTVGANTLVEAHAPNIGGAWTRQFGANGITINAAADNARNVAAGDWSIYTNATAPTGGATQVVLGIDVSFTNNSTNNYVNLIARASVALLNGYVAQVRASNDGSGTNVQIIQVVGGVQTTVASASVALALSPTVNRIRFSVKNASKEIWINGVLRASTATNAVATTGSVGFAMNSNVAAQTVTDWFFASVFAPTAASRLDASAMSDGSRTLVEWTTAGDMRNLGFRVYRDEGKRRVRISSGLVAGSAFLVAGGSLPAGNSYRWVDTSPRKARSYWIEEIDLQGRSEWHGPFVPRAGTIDSRVGASPTLTDLRQRDEVAPRVKLEPATLAESAGAARRRAVDPGLGRQRRQWDLASQQSLKIGVRDEGVYRITRDELATAGFDVSGNPRSLRLYDEGAEVAILVEGEADSQLDAGDAITFFGRPLDTPSTDTRTYWLVAGEGNGLRMATTSSSTGQESSQRNFMARADRRDKRFFAPALRNPDGDGFVGAVVSADAAQPTNQTIRLQHVDPSGASATVTVSLQGVSAVEGSEHRVAVSLNGQPLGEMNFLASSALTTSFVVPLTSVIEGDNVVSLVGKSGDADVSAVLSVAIEYPHSLEADSDRLLAIIDEGQTSIRGFSGDDIQLFDVTNPEVPSRIEPASLAGGAVTFTPSGKSRTVLAMRAANLLHPAFVAQNEPSSLNRVEGADEVIITHAAFASALAPLAELRRAQGLSVEVVKSDDVYDEFSFGAKDPWAIRAFLLHASRRWQKPPRYVLLVGDASFDPRNHLGLGSFDFVPTKLVVAELLLTASDTWFVDFDSDNAPDVPIGRIPARTIDDARITVEKIVAYENASAPSSKRVLFVTDADPTIDFHAATVQLQTRVPDGFDVVDLDANQTGAADVRQQLLSGFRDAFLIDYVGHGSVEIWSNGSIFGRADAAAMTVTDARFPFVVAMTCLNGYFHDLYTESLAEALLRAPGGAIAVWSSSALTSPEAQLPVNDELLKVLLGADGDIRLGDAVVAAQKTSATPDIRQTFLLFGDPATRMRIAH